MSRNASLRKQLPESHRQSAIQDGEASVQAGRSATSLRVERATADIQRERIPYVGRQEGNQTPGLRGVIQGMNSPGATGSRERRLSYAPAISSPFNPSASQLSVSSNEYRGVVSGFRSPSTPRSSLAETPPNMSTGSVPLLGRGGRRSSRMSSPLQHSPLEGFTPLATPGFTPLATPNYGPGPERPKSLRDLGRDYSRYPPTTSRQGSYMESRTPVNELMMTSASDPSLLSGTTAAEPREDWEKCGYPDDSLGAFDPYFGGEKGFILYKEEVEADDKHHLPAEDDNRTYRPRISDYLHRKAIISGIGGIMLVMGLIFLFIIFPVLTYSSRVYMPLGSHNHTRDDSWSYVNNKTHNVLKNVRRGLIDPDTPERAKTRKSALDGSMLHLVFSDEFNEDGRTFYEGDDPYWTAPNIWYGATKDLEWYDPDAVTTRDGTLQLRMDETWNHDLLYRSGMLNSWNQLCFKGGVFEVSVSLAGPAGVPGLWPGLWAMGNLGRPGYRATTDGVWPYTYDGCDYGILPNQSSPDGISWLPGQRLSACTCKGADHPNRGTGRGAPEIDVIEGGVDPNNRIGAVTQSYQVAPFDVFYRPNYAFVQIPNYETTSMNTYCGGPYQQAISGTTMLNNKWYDGQEYQKYAFEYEPGNAQGKIAWFVGDQQSFLIDGRSIGQNGNVGPRQVSQEPMSMVMNLGMSNSWTQIFTSELRFPTIMHIDYVRVYQKAGQTVVTCDPPGYPTTAYIEKHAAAYKNPNFTTWEEAGFSWPKNKLTGC